MPTKKPTHGGKRPGAGRKKINGRVHITVRINRELQQRLMGKIGKKRGALTRYIEDLIKADLDPSRT